MKQNLSEQLLTECDKEPIHIPGSIQPYGYFVGIDLYTGCIRYLSENITEVVHEPASDLFGEHYQKLFPNSNFNRLVRYSSQNKEADSHLVHDKLWIRHGEHSTYYDVLMHTDESILTVEFVPEELENAIRHNSLHSMVASANALCVSCESTESLMHHIPQLIRQVTGYDRVMLYRFDEECNGTVVAESKSEKVGSFLYHSFPASDIPSQARELYRKNVLRVIGNVGYTPVSIISNEDQVAPLDMSFCTLRSISPIHIEYLQNMEIQASMSMSILNGDRLWGMIACHHKTPRYIPLSMWNGFVTLAHIISNNITLRLRLDANSEQMLKENQLASYCHIAKAFSKEKPLLETLDEIMDLVSDLFEASGCALFKVEQTSSIVKAWNDVPDDSALLKVFDAIPSQASDIYATHKLQQSGDLDEQTIRSMAGVLSIPLCTSLNLSLMFLRPEIHEEKVWAGEPGKSNSVADGKMVISPRKSFESWKETIKGSSKPWSELDMRLAGHFSKNLVEILYSLKTQDDLTQSQKALREKNTLLIQQSKMASMGEMIHAITHQWKQPLSVLNMAMHTVYDDLASDEEKKASFELQQQSIRFMDQTINDFRDFFKPSQTQTCQLKKAIEHLMRMLQKSYVNMGITINYNEDALTNLVVKGSCSGFQQVLINLLSNSKDAIMEIREKDKRYKGQIHLCFKEEDQDVLLTYKDNGGGIPASIINQVFESHVSTKGDKGSGIGMKIVHDIIRDKMGGDIQVENSKEGAVFSIRLKKA